MKERAFARKKRGSYHLDEFVPEQNMVVRLFSIGTGMIARSCADAAMLAAKKSRKIQAIFMCAFS